MAGKNTPHLLVTISLPGVPSLPTHSRDCHLSPDEASGQVTPTLTDESTYSQHEQRMANKPEGFIMYNRHLKNHAKYGKKLTLKDGAQGYPHYI